MEAKTDAQMAHDEAMKAKNMTAETKQELDDLVDNIKKFLLGDDAATPEDVQKVCYGFLSYLIYTAHYLVQLVTIFGVFFFPAYFPLTRVCSYVLIFMLFRMYNLWDQVQTFFFLARK